MKQYITQKQWDELDDTQQNMLYYKIYPEMLNIGQMLNLNIGQMIEFLGEDWYNTIFFAYPDDGGATVYLKDEEKELCDNLWKAIKYKLKK